MEQQQEHEEQLIEPQAYYQHPAGQFGSSIISLTNPEETLQKMEMNLRGMIEDANGKPKQVGEALMNDVGIRNIMGLAQGLISRIMFLSNMEKENVEMMIEYLVDTLDRDLMMNRVPYGIKQSNDRSKISFIVVSGSFAALKRAQQEGERRFWKGSQQETIIRQESNQPKGNILTRMAGWK